MMHTHTNKIFTGIKVSLFFFIRHEPRSSADDALWTDTRLLMLLLLL